MACWLGRLINPGIPHSKPLDGSKVISVFQSSEVDQMSKQNPWDVVLTSKLSPQSGFVAVRCLNPLHKKGP